MILFGERSLRRVLNEYIVYYHAERNHQGLVNRLLDPTHEAGSTDDPIQHRERLGVILNFYYCGAAWKCMFHLLHHTGSAVFALLGLPYNYKITIHKTYTYTYTFTSY